ncbi:MAG: amidohydrolase family protein, partial [Gemmatimonadota bacterium]
RHGIVRRYRDYAATRPVEAETAAVALMIRLASEYRAAVHIVHVSSGAAARMIASARASGVSVSGETCPHYLTFAAEEIADGMTAFKCAPPIREAAEREALWTALDAAALQLIVSDHSPSPSALKSTETGDLMSAWGGISSLQVSLPAVWAAARARGVGVDRVVQWMATGPADFVRLSRKGRIAVGCDADFVFFDPDASWTVDAAKLEHRHPITPYHGLTLAGRVRATYLRGELIYDGHGFPSLPHGRLLHRNEA